MGPHNATGHEPPYVDQVIRKERFLHAYPSVEIHSPRKMGGNEWVATWDEENGSNTITRFELRDILDILEDRFGMPGNPA